MASDDAVRVALQDVAGAEVGAVAFERMAVELARLRRIEAAVRALVTPRGSPWWDGVGADGVEACVGCSAYGKTPAFEWPHAPDCAAMALDAALAEGVAP